jgi:cell division protein FtsB
MKRGISLLIALYCAFLTYSVMTYVWGENGIIAYSQLETYEQRLENNIEQLRGVGQKLSAKTESLQSDAEALALSARDMGYYRENERIIYIEGYDAQESLYVVGELMRPFSRDRVNPLVFRVFAVFVGIVGYIVSRYARWRRV